VVQFDGRQGAEVWLEDVGEVGEAELFLVEELGLC
jgi:hypothetical protein